MTRDRHPAGDASFRAAIVRSVPGVKPTEARLG